MYCFSFNVKTLQDKKMPLASASYSFFCCFLPNEKNLNDPKTHWRCFQLEVGETDEQDVRVETRGLEFEPRELFPLCCHMWVEEARRVYVQFSSGSWGCLSEHLDV